MVACKVAVHPLFSIPTKPMSDLSTSTETQFKPNILIRLLQQERRNCLYLHPHHPSEDLHNLTNIQPIPEHILDLQKNFIQRTLKSNITSHRNIFLWCSAPVRKKTTQKLTLPTARLLNQTKDLDAELQRALDRTPILVR